MFCEIIKRDGTKAAFEPYKIEDAIKKAFESVSTGYDGEIFWSVLSKVYGRQKAVAVEDVQDTIEKTLFDAGYFEVMRSFILYRHTHKMQREHILGLNDDTTYIDSTQSVEEYITGFDWRIKANANTGYSNAGLINNLAGKVIANYWLDKVYSKEEGYAHRNGDYHIHDLDCLTGYCAGWSLRALLNEGFNGVRGRVESKAPSHFREALGQMANFLGILQSEWAGAQAFSSFDTYLAPYVFKDRLGYDEVKKALKSFIYNLNVPARWGQSPFTNVTIDWSVPEDLAEQIPTKNDKHLFCAQLPVWHTEDPYEALRHQDDLQCKYTGGTVLHLYMGERLSSAEGCRIFVKKVLENFKLPYITVTPLFSVCEKHGYISGEHEFCPLCDEEIILKERSA